VGRAGGRDLLSGRRVTWVLLDRDGTINVPAAPGDYITTASEVRLLPRAGDAIARLNRAGLPVAIVTNQRGVALGLMTEHDLDAVNERLRAQLAANDAHVEAIFCCTHGLDACDCRKPRTGLLEQAAAQLGLPLEQAVLVGDAETDIEAGARTGALTIRLHRGGGRADSAADFVVATLWDAVDICVRSASRA
jgi:D-glycero-D-manno-heptose 1,7-bisphosphate phosphatase